MSWGDKEAENKGTEGDGEEEWGWRKGRKRENKTTITETRKSVVYYYFLSPISHYFSLSYKIKKIVLI